MATVFPTDQVIVVGGGLAGVSACNTVVENGGKTVLIDKSSFCGGNSTKATSGINGAATRTQKDKGIEDSTDLFTKDTLKGGAKKPEIVKVLCENSGRDVEWLMDAFNLDLSLVARLGGHSAPRTHRGKERFPGMTITYALIQMVEKISEMTDKARIITKAKGTKLLQGSDGSVVGLVYEKGGVEFQEHGPVILCTGGFGADFTSNSLLAKYRPDLMHLPTTNGEHCTGDGIKMGEAIGAKTIDLEWVQVHPTGLVKPDDADAKIKFLAAEALRGVGGIILDKEGKRFANELGRRDYVTGEMWKNKPPFRLVLNKAASDEIIWHCKHYTGRGVMKYYASGEDLAKDMGVPISVLEESHEGHYQAAKKTEKDPDGGSYPAYPSGKSWDEPSGKTGSGKKFYHNIIPGSAVKSQPFYVAIITPVIHYCMGGLEIDADGAVLGSKGVIKGLYCAGEVAGGVHGNNRLGGNSLLDCVVFGRVTGEAATKYILGKDVKKVDLKELTKGGLTGEVKASKLSGGSYEDGMNKADAAKPKEDKVVVNWPDAPSTHDGIPGSPYLLRAGGRSDVAPRVACFEDSTGRTMAGIVAACLVFAFIAVNYLTPQPH
jgi:flavocytochrome c